MKHIKLFENFDRYEFGNNDANEYLEMLEYIEPFTRKDIEYIGNLLNEEGIYYRFDAVGDKRIEIFEFIDKNDNDNRIDICYLGDFCYGIYNFNMNDYRYELAKLVVVDDVDGILEVVKKMLVK